MVVTSNSSFISNSNNSLMKVFILKISLFLSGWLLIIAIGIVLPATPRASNSLLFARIDKDHLLATAKSPRIILIGGSNVSLSINSQIIKDSLRYNPVNTGISANIGLAYMLDHTLAYVRPGDIIVVSPEYSQFYDELAYGREELLRTILDVAPHEIFKLRKKQLWHVIKYIPRYALSKFKPSEYASDNADETSVYERSAFNQFGDAYRHWEMAPQTFPALEPPSNYDPSVVNMLLDYKLDIEQRGATLYITFPALEKSSFENQVKEIATVEKDLRRNGFNLLGNPQRYKMPQEIMFDTPYHLTKQGVDYRTQLLVSDIRKNSIQTFKSDARTISSGLK